ncbi:MAG: sugar phosphate isomerase/epimerase [Rubripirellula sp.]|nr:sugar phosphate isomerase/epimerase [Rubripirellula sp.]
MNQNLHRRDFVKNTLITSCLASVLADPVKAQAKRNSLHMQFGLVTYLWGKDMKLADLIETCEASGIHGVELRTEHAHGVEPILTASARNEVKKRFADSPVELVGYGSNAQYHENDPTKLRQNIELTKRYIELMHDCGGTGVKVKPNGIPSGVSKQKTIEQIGKSLNEVAEYGEGYGQQIRVEVHGKETSELPVMREIFQIADHPNATICWNSNDIDLTGQGLEQNFAMVKDRFGSTVHIRELNQGNYPYDKLFKLFADIQYDGWILLEARTNPADKIQALIEQRERFEQMLNAI